MDFTDRVSSRMSDFRRRAESMMTRMTRPTLESSLKQEQEHKRQAMAAKTERLRELRLAKEAAERKGDRKPARQQKRRPRRIKCY
jgi:hypothetical protein